MDRLIYTAMTGASATMGQEAAVSHNLANATSTGFKAELHRLRAVPVQNALMPTRAFVVDASVQDDLSTGPLQHTNRPFDVAVQGNIRMPGQTWGETGRCVFSEHYFVETGADTRWYLDPCMFTSYSTTAEVMSWKLYSGGGPFSSCVKRVDGDATQVLLRVPPADTAPKPNGFESGLVNFKSADFKSDALLALRGHRENPQWSESKFKTHRDTAMATINKLLRERAGVNAEWSVPPNS